MRITSLHTYPVKGCRRLDHDEAVVEPWGFAADRRWMAIGPDGVGITQRQAPALTRLRALPQPGGVLLTILPANAASPTAAPRDGLPVTEPRDGSSVAAPRDDLSLAGPRDGLLVAEPVGGPEVAIRVFREKPPVAARLAVDAEEFLSDLLRRPARLAWLADPTARPIQHNALPADRVSFADGFPVLLTNEASLAALGLDLPMTRFRPNIVITGADAWTEDTWIGGRLRIGGTLFRVAEACNRCVVTTIDQDNGTKAAEPLRTLGRLRRRNGKIPFGVLLIPDIAAGETHVIRQGDAVLSVS
ncbi:MOSC domain-containing protein [Actinoplanes sp. N902-109]|uniref:MOSC domain-containing protein n=1 Tax=Actinoplanes sp. (strain N902-109) TaxID=649831 RepID=UPI0003294B85|nr:MOSC N-terminal beta barrel domain-containing protein [Actinoplanes sp. N902-109]AGL14803.1 MOSC domain-containing protein [Actinoplanes sp. N902-109]